MDVTNSRQMSWRPCALGARKGLFGLYRLQGRSTGEVWGMRGTGIESLRRLKVDRVSGSILFVRPLLRRAQPTS